MKIIAPFLLFLLLAPMVLAAELHPMDRFVDENTFLVLRLAPEESATKILDVVAQAMPGDEPEVQQEILKGKLQVAGVISMLQNAGLQEAYVMMSLSEGISDPREWFHVAVRTKPGTNDEVLKTFLTQGFGDLEKRKLVLKRIDEEYLLAGLDNVVERFPSQTPVAHPELWAAFDSIDGSLAKAVFITPDYARRVIREMMPTLPEKLGGGSSDVLTDGIQTAVVGLSTTPEVALTIQVRSKDADTAQAFCDWSVATIRRIPQMVAETPGTPDISVPLGKIIELYQPTVDGDQIDFSLKESTGQITGLIQVVRPAILAARDAAQRTATTNQFKELGLAMHNYEDQFKTLPPAIFRDKERKPLLSWRVHVLPYLGENELYKQFKLDEPWDSPNNKPLIDKMPVIFHSNASKNGRPGMTNFVVLTGENTLFPGDRAISFKEITDGTSNTLMIVEADDAAAVIWTKPEDLEFDVENPKKHLGNLHPNGIFITTVGDGSVLQISAKTTSEEKMRNWLLRNDGK